MRAMQDNTPEALPLCPLCGEEIEPDDGTYEGDTLFHYCCCPPEEMDDSEGGQP
jgi:hypothetical protein